MFNRNKKKEILVYLFLGFLESGKSTLMKNSLADPQFNNGEKNLIILCEEGLEEFDEDFLETTNSVLEIVEEQETLTGEYLDRLQEKYNPDRVMVEYNGMWSAADFMELELPKGWIPVQCITTVNAETLDLYLGNMRSLMVEHFQHCDVVIYNRCTLDNKKAAMRRIVKGINGNAAIAYESDDPAFYEAKEEDLPYDIHADVITIEDDDFGIWYLDARDNPQNYKDKTVQFKAFVKRTKTMPKNQFIPGRHIMTCCEDDIAFLGFVCESPLGSTIKNDTWITITARVTYEKHPAYNGQEGPVLHARNIAGAEKPKNTVTTFD